MTFLFILLSLRLISQPIHISQPAIIADDDWRFEGTENILLVPENRNDPESRLITLHFFHFPALEESKLAPVAFLGAGPGEPYSEEVFYDGKRAESWRYELEKVNKNRDILLINQRGNSDAPGLQINNFRYKWWNGGSLDKAFDIEDRNQRRKKAYAEALDLYKEKGVDLRGYDIMHFVEDIDEVRKFIGVEKLALIGNSFGSQWGLAYIQKYPDRVDRALFSGVEPINNNYDDAQGIWQVLEMIAEYAAKDKAISESIPEEGLIEVFKTIIKRLEAKPVTVELIDEAGEMEEVVVGVEDLRMNLKYNKTRTYAGEVETWPKYIMEMYNGDFRMLALMSVGRMYNSSNPMINPLVNNSLGVSAAREEALLQQPAVRWLGNINSAYTITRDICPTPKVSEDFLKPLHHDVPVILIHGDMDMSTPYGNATELMGTLENGHLITVKRGFHNAKRGIILNQQLIADKIFDFMDVDFKVESFNKFKRDLPSIVEMENFDFMPIGGESLYEKMRKQRSN